MCIRDRFYIAPLQDSLLRSTPSPTSVKQDSLKGREELSRVGYWGQTQCHWKPIPGHRASHREGAALSDSSPSTGTRNSACTAERNETCLLYTSPSPRDS